MKIISRGEVKLKKYQTVCRKCTSTLEFDRDDGLVLNDRNELVLKVVCPVCSSDIYVNL